MADTTFYQTRPALKAIDLGDDRFAVAVVSAGSEQNLLTFQVIDPNNRFARSSLRVTWTDLTKNEDAFVYLDKTAGFFAANFDHTFRVNISAADAASSTMSAVWMVSNDLREVVAQTDALTLQFTMPGAGPRFFLQELVGDAPNNSAVFPIVLGADYYMTVTRDEATGVNGTLTCKIYSDAQRTILLDTLTVTLNAKVDFRYIFPIASHNSSLAKKHSGFTEGLDLDLPDSTFVNTRVLSEPLNNRALKAVNLGDGTFALGAVIV